MKLIIAGAAGYVATEIIRLAFRHRGVTSIVALSRSPVSLPPGEPDTNASKLKSVVVPDYSTYSDEVKSELAGAGACIWTVAITPSKSLTMDWAEVKRVCYDWTMDGFKAIHAARPAPGFRFLYISGVRAARTEAERPRMMGDYCIMRGTTENQVLAYASENGFQAAVAKLGLVINHRNPAAWPLAKASQLASEVGLIRLDVVATAVLDQAVNGFEKDPLADADLERIASAVNSSTVE